MPTCVTIIQMSAIEYMILFNHFQLETIIVILKLKTFIPHSTNLLNNIA